MEGKVKPISTLTAFLFIFLFFGVPTLSSASVLDGKTIDYQYYTPSLSYPYHLVDKGNNVVGDGIEILNIVDNRGTMDISDNNIFIDFSVTGFLTNIYFPSTEYVVFTGWVLLDVFKEIDSFYSVSISSATNMVGFDASRIFFDDDSIRVDFSGLYFNDNTVLSLDINVEPAPVPEPGSIVLLGMGLVSLAIYRSKRKQ
jgi:hypothetical protein